MKITMLSAGLGPQYVVEVVNALANNGIDIDLVASDDYLGFSYHKKVNMLNYRGSGRNIIEKITRVFKYPLLLICYIFRTKNRVFHVQWNKFVFSEGVILNLVLKMAKKNIVYTAHDVLPFSKEHTFKNRWMYKFIYRIVDKIIVHTPKTKKELLEFAKVDPNKVIVCPHGIYTIKENLYINKIEAKEFLKIHCKRNLLFFGYIREHKGVDILLKAIKIVNEGEQEKIGLIIAGRGHIPNLFKNEYSRLDYVKLNLGRIPDNTIPYYFNAVDAIVLPYKKIYQSGVLFLALTFGTPIIATDVGSFSDYIIDGENGILCEPNKVNALAEAIKKFYSYTNWDRVGISRKARDRYSWVNIVKDYIPIYNNLS